MIDTHSHLTHARLAADLPDVLLHARQAGLEACITIGTGVADARHALELSQAHPGFVHCSAGIDPFTAHRAGDGFGDELAHLAELLERGGFSALGEVGLDYHYDLDPRPVQAAKLEAQLDLATRLDLPVVIHVREAHADMIALLGGHPRVRGVIHSFTGGPDEATAYLELGWYLAFNGVLTFTSAHDVREAARLAPAERLLVETDAPYLAPVPHRGKRCEPSYVAHTLEALARLRGQSADNLAVETTVNAQRLFALPGAATA
jgi:TatD DNase family protein